MPRRPRIRCRARSLPREAPRGPCWRSALPGRLAPPRHVPGTPAPDRSMATRGRRAGPRRGWPSPAGPLPTARRRSPVAPQALGRVLRPQDLLVELPDARLRDLGDKLEPGGQPPLREHGLEVLQQLLPRRRLSLLQDHTRQRALAPPLVRDRDD